MTQVRLLEHVRAELLDHARTAAPEECCGMVVGSGDLIDESVRMRNVAADRAMRYRVDPAEHIALNRRLRGTGRVVMGAYHSHPRGSAVPSDTDRSEALYPEFIWLIVSLAPPDGRIAAFSMTDGGVRELPIVVEH